jgi:hypothetical protein
MSGSPISADPILRLALRVARRADEIAQSVTTPPAGVEPWLQAEEEILRVRLPPPRLPAAISRRAPLVQAEDAMLSSR